MTSVRIAIGSAQYRVFNSLSRRILGLRRKTVVVDGVVIPVVMRPGRGEPILFVHGFGADKEGWFNLMHRFPKRAVIALDLPGFGAASDISGEHASAERQAHAIRGVLDALEVARASLIGASMGGGISLRFAAEFPRRTRALALLGSVGPMVKQSELAIAIEQGNNPLIPRSHDEFHAMLEFVAAEKPWVPASIAAYLASEQVAKHAKLTDLFAGWVAQKDTIDAHLARIEAPTLVIHGELDRVIDVSTAHAIAEHVPQSKLMVLSGIGHVPQLEAPRTVARAITRFFDAHA